MNTLLSDCLVLVLCLAYSTSGHVLNDRTRRATAEGNSITFISRDGKRVVEEQVLLTDNEARFDVMGMTAYVLDYEQNLLFVKELEGVGKPCHVANFDMNAAGIPYPDEIREELLSNSKFEMPVDKLQIRLQKSREQEPPSNMLPLSEELCGGSEIEIIVLEPSPMPAPETAKAVAKTTTEMPKSEVGWGELILIGIVIILLL